MDVSKNLYRDSRRSLLLLLTLILAASLLIDWPSSLLNISNDSRIERSISLPPVGAIGDKANELLLNQYGNAVKEIQTRLQQENVLFAMKFSLVGAILGLMFNSAIKSQSRLKSSSVENSTITQEMKSDKNLFFVNNWTTIALFCWAATITSAIICIIVMLLLVLVLGLN